MRPLALMKGVQKTTFTQDTALGLATAASIANTNAPHTGTEADFTKYTAQDADKNKGMAMPMLVNPSHQKWARKSQGAQHEGNQGNTQQGPDERTQPRNVTKRKAVETEADKALVSRKKCKRTDKQEAAETDKREANEAAVQSYEAGNPTAAEKTSKRRTGKAETAEGLVAQAKGNGSGKGNYQGANANKNNDAQTGPRADSETKATTGMGNVNKRRGAQARPKAKPNPDDKGADTVIANQGTMLRFFNKAKPFGSRDTAAVGTAVVVDDKTQPTQSIPNQTEADAARPVPTSNAAEPAVKAATSRSPLM